MDSLLKQMLTTFSDHYMHIGGDEVVENCWLEDASITAWMAQKGFDADDVYTYFVDHAQDFLLVTYTHTAS
jgi:hexosaminidase